MTLAVEKRFTLSGHKGPVYDLLQSGKKTFYSAGSDRLVVEWNADAESDGNVIAQSADSIYCIHSVPGNDHLLIGQGSGGIHVVDIKDGKELKLIQLHTAPVFRIRSFEGCPYIFSLGGDGVLQILNNEYLLLKTVTLSSEKLRCIAFDKYHNTILIGSGEGVIHVIDAESLSLKKKIQAHQEGFGINTICFADDEKTFLTGSRDAHLNIYNAENYELVQSLPAHRAAIYDISFHHSGNFFATASRDKTIKIWDASSLQVLQRLDKEHNDGHGYSVNRCIWMHDTLLTTGDDRMIICWEVSSEL